MNQSEKLSALRQLLRENDLDAYYVNTADPHQSEYIADHFRDRAWLTGFTGSAGTALVTQTEALLWVDGRYFIQAEKQLAGSEFKMMKAFTPNHPSILEWTVANLPQGAQLGFNANCVSQAFYENACQKLKDKCIKLVADTSLISEIWTDRPALPQAKIFTHELKYSGLSSRDKIAEVRAQMQNDGVQAYILVSLDDIAWLFNFRGSDIPGTPVALAFALIEENKASLFIDENKVSAEVRAELAVNGVSLYPYHAIGAAVHGLNCQRVALNKNRVSRALFRALPPNVKVLDRTDYPHGNKAKLNTVEQENQARAYVRDSAVITRFFFRLQAELEHKSLTEWDAAQILTAMRQEQDNFLEESFTTIAAYGANAAMMHYGPSADTASQLEPQGFFLCDCGGQYLDGTTDITRTIALGELTPAEIRDYTLTLKSHINLARAVFLEGCSGHYLDVLARQPLWQHYSDYKCGTGHAVGYVLGVHEGPQRLSRVPSEVILEAGMILTIEPGVYKQGAYGIRLENDYIVQKAALVDGDQYYRFAVLSYVPFELKAIDKEMLDKAELAWLNDYHQAVYEKLAPHMPTEAELLALKAACRAL